MRYAGGSTGRSSSSLPYGSMPIWSPGSKPTAPPDIKRESIAPCANMSGPARSGCVRRAPVNCAVRRAADGRPALAASGRSGVQVDVGRGDRLIEMRDGAVAGAVLVVGVGVVHGSGRILDDHRQTGIEVGVHTRRQGGRVSAGEDAAVVDEPVGGQGAVRAELAEGPGRSGRRGAPRTQFELIHRR